jgi:hypothetical protein
MPNTLVMLVTRCGDAKAQREGTIKLTPGYCTITWGTKMPEAFKTESWILVEQTSPAKRGMPTRVESFHA